MVYSGRLIIRMTRKKTPHLYQKYFTSAEDLRLKAIPENDVSSEINLLRICLAHYIECYGNSLPADLKSQVSALHVTGEAASMIGSLVRTQIKAHNPQTILERAIKEALLSLDPYTDL